MTGLVVLLSTVLLQAGPQPQPAPVPAFRVIVEASNPVEAVSRQTLSNMFTRRLRRWPDGSEIHPVDQIANTRIRERFSRAIHGKSVAYVVRYWHRLIFSGRGIPPLEVTSDAAVIEYVQANRGAVGYVRLDVPLPADVKELAVTP